jgi:hypothetical protein
MVEIQRALFQIHLHCILRFDYVAEVTSAHVGHRLHYGAMLLQSLMLNAGKTPS